MSETDFTSTPRDFYVYAHKKANGQIFYIGKGQGRRAWLSIGRSAHWVRTVKKHGLKVEIIQDGLQEWAAHELECNLIALHGRRDCGHGQLVNLTDGGEGVTGWVRSEDTVAKQNLAAKARAKDPEWRAKVREFNQALHANPEFRVKHKAAIKISTSTPEWRANNKAAMQARFQDPKYRAKNMAAIHLLWQNQDFRKKHKAKFQNPEYMAKHHEIRRTPEYRAKAKAATKARFQNPEYCDRNKEMLRARCAKKTVCIETGMIFTAAMDAVRWLQSIGHTTAGSSRLSAACTGKQKTAYGYTWRYVEAEQKV